MLFRMCWRTGKVCFLHTYFSKILVTKDISCWPWYLVSGGLHTGGLRLNTKSSKDKVTLKHTGKTVRKKQDVDFSKIQERLEKVHIEVSTSHIKENWKLLKSVGCFDDHLYCYPKILGLSKYELLSQIGKLYGLGCEQISVGLLRLARRYTKKLEQKVEEFLEDDFNLTATAVGILRCSKTDLDTLLERNPQALETVTTNPQLLKDKVELLYKNGYSVNDIVRYPEILSGGFERLKERIALIREIEGLKKMPLLCSLDHPNFEDYLQRLCASGHLHKESYKLREFAKMFHINEDNVMLTRQLNQTSMVLTKNKLAVLEEAGYKTREVMCKPIILYYSKESIRQSVEYIKNRFPDSVGDLNQLSNILQDKVYRKNRITSDRLVKHIAKCLDIKFSSFTETQKQAFGIAAVSTVNENMALLKTNGFSKSDIRSCPLILVQEPEVIQQYINVVHSSDHLKHFREDNIKFLNVVQYLIEFDSKIDHEE